MKSTVETLSPTRVRFAIEVPFPELEPSLRKAYREIGGRVNVPGFRKGKVPTAVIDQRIGRGNVLTEAVQDAIPTQIMAAVKEHELRTLGRPEVEITDFKDGEPLKFTAEVDIRPKINMPELGAITVVVDPVEVTDADVELQVESLRRRFGTLKTTQRPAQDGDFLQLDLEATVDGEAVEGGTATNLSYEVGTNQLVSGLDEAVVGLSADESVTFMTDLVAGDLAGRQAEVNVTVRSVKERELPELDDDFAQLASEFDTLVELRADLAERARRGKRSNQLTQARDKTLESLIAAADVPAPEGVVRDEAADRKHTMQHQLEELGSTLEAYLEHSGKSAEEFESDLTEAAANGVRAQLILDAFAEAETISVTEDEYGQEIVHRAQQAGMAPQKYYDELVAAGAGAVVFGDIRRSKALSELVRRVKIVDTTGVTVSFEVDGQ